MFFRWLHPTISYHPSLFQEHKFEGTFIESFSIKFLLLLFWTCLPETPETKYCIQVSIQGNMHWNTFLLIRQNIIFLATSNYLRTLLVRTSNYVPLHITLFHHNFLKSPLWKVDIFMPRNWFLKSCWEIFFTSEASFKSPLSS